MIEDDGDDVERMQPGELPTERQRRDLSIRCYLLMKRPRAEDLERVTSYRTEACVGFNQAHDDGAPQRVLDTLRAEYDWALGVLRAAGRPVPEDQAR